MVHSHIKPHIMPMVHYYMKAKQNICISTISFTFYKNITITKVSYFSQSVLPYVFSVI